MNDEFRESEKFKRGRAGEQVVADMLKRRGWFVIPSYDYAGEDGNKAPKMTGQRVAYVIPDLDIARAGVRIWAEVKTKAAPTLHRISGTFEHGIPLRHFQHYKEVQKETGCEVWLFVLEEETQTVRFAKLDDLGSGRVYDGRKMSRGGMVFWPVTAFRVFGPVGAAA